MYIVPKFSEFDHRISEPLFQTIESRIEIQMLTRDLQVSLANSIIVIKNILARRNLEEVVLHMPFDMHTFELFIYSSKLRESLQLFLSDVSAISAMCGISIGVLFHQEVALDFRKVIPNADMIMSEILDSVAFNPLVFFLVENCLPDFNSFDARRISAFDLLEVYNNSNLFACIDVCHAVCYQNLLSIPFDVPEHVRSRVRWVHFASTWDKDGFKDKSTHGRKHQTLLDAMNDLVLLESNGIDTGSVPIVAEISEDDYSARPDMLAEIKILKNRVIRDYFHHS